MNSVFTLTEDKHETHKRLCLTQEWWRRRTLVSDGQFVSYGHEHFENGHKRWDLAEVAAAHHLRVDLQTLRVVPGGDAAGDLVQAHEDAGG